MLMQFECFKIPKTFEAIRRLSSVLQTLRRSLTTLAEDFQNISESCLLVLHLEIRCHCFYYLMRVVQEVSRLLACFSCNGGLPGGPCSLFPTKFSLCSLVSFFFYFGIPCCLKYQTYSFCSVFAALFSICSK